MVAFVWFYKGKAKFKLDQISKTTTIILKLNLSARNCWKSKMGREKLIVDAKEG